jgi:tryptophan synthase alpha chain
MPDVSLNARPSERIAAAFARARAAGRPALIAYLVAGDPDVATSERIVERVAAAGADLIELGIPYGDPLADGPTIAAAGQRALAGGTTIDVALGIAKRALAPSGVPAIAFTYFNPISQYGLERFAAAAAEAGLLGAIVPDLPMEELQELHAAFAPHGLAVPLLIAPTTPVARARTIAARSEGFVYVVSRLGVTGARREPDLAWIAGQVAALRDGAGETPIAVGFGISTPAHARAVATSADGVIIGSALIDAFAGVAPERAPEAAERYIRSIAEAISSL